MSMMRFHSCAAVLNPLQLQKCLRSAKNQEAVLKLKRASSCHSDQDFATMYQSPTTNQLLHGYSPFPAHPVYGEFPVDICCPYCQTRVFTITTKEDGNLTYCAASLLCFMGCWFGCCLIPFCIDSCKDIIHTCPNCRAPVGKFNRLC